MIEYGSLVQIIDCGECNKSQVYEGKSCVNTIQMSALLTFDAKRDLDRAAHYVKSLDEQCCDVMAVFADIQHSGGNSLFANYF